MKWLNDMTLYTNLTMMICHLSVICLLSIYPSIHLPTYLSKYSYTCNSFPNMPICLESECHRLAAQKAKADIHFSVHKINSHGKKGEWQDWAESKTCGTDTSHLWTLQRMAKTEVDLQSVPNLESGIWDCVPCV